MKTETAFAQPSSVSVCRCDADNCEPIPFQHTHTHTHRPMRSHTNPHTDTMGMHNNTMLPCNKSTRRTRSPRPIASVPAYTAVYSHRSRVARCQIKHTDEGRRKSCIGASHSLLPLYPVALDRSSSVIIVVYFAPTGSHV